MAYSIKQLADRWQTSERTIRRMIAAGSLATFRIGIGTQREAVRISGESVMQVEAPVSSTKSATRKQRNITPQKRWV